MDWSLFWDILSIDSTSGKERDFAQYLQSRLKASGAGLEGGGVSSFTARTFEVGDGTLNLLLSWGQPRFYFCTHMDTVPPYIPPVIEDNVVRGRGSCDAKGQLFSMFSACRLLEAEGMDGFALLLLAGEETGSYGAKAYTRDCDGGEAIIVGEPTDCKMVTAAKGTKAFRLTVKGKPCHSGYPSQGKSAVMSFLEITDILRSTQFDIDPLLGATTWNIGDLHSPNPQNILSGVLSFRIYFRTTPASEAQVIRLMEGFRSDDVTVESFGGDTPIRFTSFAGIPETVVSFGSDAPRLTGFPVRMLYGAGSILVAHTDAEYVLKDDLKKACATYVRIAKAYLNGEEDAFRFPDGSPSSLTNNIRS